MWNTVGDNILTSFFELENIWQKNWIGTEQVAIIRDYWPEGDNRDLVLRIWEVDIHGKIKPFAAGEAGGMGRWVFALRDNDVEFLSRSKNGT
ncbi:hypothetical protein LJR071_001778 [Pseudomonas sp. LjRoot71]|uniref:hypothetical protein n=1 Tax=Pseudomonas sp. LjRoot71 TaxID=3342336 RepID=UPI003ECD23D8